MKRLHVVPGLDAIGNGMSVAAHLIADAVGDDLIEARLFAKGNGDINSYNEIWVHSCWLPSVLRSCRRVVNAGKSLVCMPHGNLDPVRLCYHAWKKTLVSPIERACLRRAKTLVATCEAEKGWIQDYLCNNCPPIEVTDIKRFFKLVSGGVVSGGVCSTNSQLTTHNSQLHLLYLGRRHPLKGLEYLETAVSQLNSSNPPLKTPPLLRIVSNAFGDELEKVWDWCDVLILPTLSDNFGLVIAEALERGKRVITTDGAPAWGDGDTYEGRLIYLKGYRDGKREERVSLLKAAIEKLLVASG